MARTSPANMLPPEYDDVQPTSYDPEFTADISTKMRVPDKLGVTTAEMNDPARNAERQVQMEQELHMEQKRSATMNVPEKIIILGQDQSLGTRGDLKLNFESSPLHDMHMQHLVSLQTPPRVLTLEEQPFPPLGEHMDSEIDAESRPTKNHVSFQNGYVQQITPTRLQNRDALEKEALDSSALLIVDDDEDDDMKILQKKVAKLSLHVMRLQEENGKRAQREVVFYPLVLGYLLFHVARWFLRKDY